MKNIISVFGLALLCSSPAYAQYKMELDKVATPQLNYIKMGHPGAKGQEIRINNLYWEEAGKPKFPVMGEFHYNRMDERYWRESLMKMKASGVDIVSTYNLWVLHEEFEGRQDWSGRNNLRKFVELCKEVGLKVHLRPGPYCNAEIRNGGFPDWIEFNKNLKTRTNDPLYLEYVKYWYQSLFNQVKGLLYKDGGPIVAIQLENEYVTEGMVVPHLTALKEIAVEAGFDLPVYSMTHWMMSDYPKGEIIPYAGYYLETPWISFGDKENPTTDQEFFSYNRVSDNIGNDFIKTSAKVESLDASANDSPYFTCEMGLGAPNYYMRRAVVEEEMAGENINLRLGCGVNLMGYYMYVGQTDPIGEQYTTARATARVSNDYQAPIREFGQLGVVMKESKKLNYFMNDFGSELVSKRAFLPLANRDRKNLQWAVRTDGKSGYVFCSNILHKHPRKEYRNVQFNLELDGEKVCLPRKKTTIKDRSYFFWPFNMDLKGIVLNYATAQPICHLDENGTRHYFFFEDDGIPAEFRFKAENIAEVQTGKGQVKKSKDAWFVDGLQAGKDCQIRVTGKDGARICITLLTEKESDYIWKGEVNGKKFVGLSESFLFFDKQEAFLASENPTQTFELFTGGKFVTQTYQSPAIRREAKAVAVAPMNEAQCIRPAKGQWVKRTFDARNLAAIERAYLRMQAAPETKAFINGKEITTTDYQGYRYADVTKVCTDEMNEISFQTAGTSKDVTAEVEVMLANCTRLLWSTDALWRCEDGRTPIEVQVANAKPSAYDEREHLAVFQVALPTDMCPEKATRIYINATGDVANAYVGQDLIHDVFINGDEWVIGLNRYTRQIEGHPTLTLRIDGLKSADINMYLEKDLIRRTDCVQPVMRSIRMEQEYVSLLKL